MEILDFIDSLRETDNYIKDIYLNGGCYQFSKLLCKMYRSAKTLIYISPCISDKNNIDIDKLERLKQPKDIAHAVTLFDGKMYDINGEFESDRNYHVPTKKELEEVEKWSFSRNYLIKLGECPNCETPFFFSSKNQIIVGEQYQ